MFPILCDITIISSDQSWSSCSCRVIIAHKLFAPLILGNVFLSYNHFVIDHKLWTCVDKTTSYDLHNPPNITCTIIKLRAIFRPELRKKQKAVVANTRDSGSIYATQGRGGGGGLVRLIENFGGLFLFMFICPIQASEAAKWLSMLSEWT